MIIGISFAQNGDNNFFSTIISGFFSFFFVVNILLKLKIKNQKNIQIKKKSIGF